MAVADEINTIQSERTVLSDSIFELINELNKYQEMIGDIAHDSQLTTTGVIETSSRVQLNFQTVPIDQLQNTIDYLETAIEEIRTQVSEREDLTLEWLKSQEPDLMNWIGNIKLLEKLIKENPDSFSQEFKQQVKIELAGLALWLRQTSVDLEK